MALCDDDQHAADLDIYISKNSRFKSFIYNRKEILSIAGNLGFTPSSQVFFPSVCLIHNDHGPMVWKRDMPSI